MSTTEETAISFAPDSRSSPTMKDFSQQTAEAEEVLAHGKNSLHATKIESIHLPSISTMKSTAPIIIVEELERAGAGLSAKIPEKPKLLPRRQRTEPNRISPVKADDQLSDIMEPAKSTYMKKYSAAHEGKVRFNLAENMYFSDTEDSCYSPEASVVEVSQIRADITDAVLEYVTSTSFKNQLSLRIINEIDANIAKAVSQVQRKEHAQRFATARDREEYLSQEQQSSNILSTPGFSEGIASVIGYALMEVREDMKNNFTSQSHELQTESPSACSFVNEIVANVFDSMLESLLPMNDDHCHLNWDVSTNEDSSMTDNLFIQESDAAIENDPLTSRVESDSDLAKSVLEVVASSEEPIPSDITSRGVQQTGHQEHAKPVPSPPSGDKPNAPRVCARRRIRFVKASSCPDIVRSGIPDQSHQKESEVKHSHSLTGIDRL
ncbi:hypothetical protein Q7C36_006981 [Tachysurus vachellii]|uniref:Uncharacterized protein n=1 Tax=Tachysurus vachellii TaxID=175792 RepID=A0AA88NAC3_TACVA|nr:hypothetical protein Q7C36_006981 [Tachysurus vachellii]